jgi:hypothetical protein
MTSCRKTPCWNQQGHADHISIATIDLNGVALPALGFEADFLVQLDRS